MIEPLDVGEPKDIDETKLGELNKLMTENKVRPIKCFIVGKKRWMRVYRTSISHGMHAEDFGNVVPRSLDRGEILDSFSKIEFMVNEIIQAVILKNDFSAKGAWLDSLNTKVDLAQKISILRDEWKIISDDTFQMLTKLRKVRNILAHSWDFGHAQYGKDKTLESNFQQFKQDLKNVWKRLVVTYDNVQPQNEFMDMMINTLKANIAKRQEQNNDGN
ncbi:MAG: hypothetical protein KJ597_02555 [Nanoarchaeota archaeon]|nr:hypothetical protein [Nanoarchaeota archaeon]MBU1622431.1 hypothetical protein [Nanoarchaeota archaeon]